MICKDLLLDEHGQKLNTSDEGQVDVCRPCQEACKWREVAIRFLHHKRKAISSHDGCHSEWLEDQKQVNEEARRLYHEHLGVLPQKLPEPPASRPGAMSGRASKR